MRESAQTIIEVKGRGRMGPRSPVADVSAVVSRAPWRSPEFQYLTEIVVDGASMMDCHYGDIGEASRRAVSGMAAYGVKRDEIREGALATVEHITNTLATMPDPTIPEADALRIALGTLLEATA